MHQNFLLNSFMKKGTDKLKGEHTDGQIDKQGDGQVDRQMDRLINREMVRWTDRWKKKSKYLDGWTYKYFEIRTDR